LVNDLNADPYGVFLLDEADKAHPDVLQPFLHLFDEGWIRDQRGVQAYADKSIFILTTNVGQRMIADMAQQGKTPDEIAVRIKETLAQIRHSKSNRPVFPPEFLARIKRVIVFEPLDRQAMEGICRKLGGQMQRAWAEKRQRKLEVPEALIQHIADEAHRLNQKAEGREGGRIVRKLMTDLIDIPIREATSKHPNRYRACSVVVLDCIQRDADSANEPPKISVRFEPSDPSVEMQATASDSSR
jgi:ATP-dependent Clp protease ATP-binding subunit ClpA